MDSGALDGKRNRKTFNTEAVARAHLKVVGGLETKIGRMAQKLNDANLRDAAAAIDILMRTLSLKTAARFYMEHTTPQYFHLIHPGRRCMPISSHRDFRISSRFNTTQTCSEREDE